MIRYLLLGTLFAVNAFAIELPMDLSADIYKTSKIPFKSHQGTKAFATYLSMELPYAPIKPLLQQLEKKLGKKLKNRGEAHITVITPPEFDNILSKFIDMNMIETVATQNKLQEAAFTVSCIGSAKVGKMETYYLVVKSDALVKIRGEITKKFLEHRGPIGVFKPRKTFYPHITLGYTDRDLHASDGVIKDEKTCIIPVTVK